MICYHHAILNLVADEFIGDPEYHVDCRVYSTKSKGADRELHQCLLSLSPSMFCMASGVEEAIGDVMAFSSRNK